MLKYFYDNEGDIPEAFKSLYTQKDGKWHLTGIEGLKTPDDIQRQLTANAAERTAHNATKAELNAFKALGQTPEELQAVVDELPTLRTKAEANGGKVDQAAIDAQITAKTAPLQRQIEALTTENATFKTENGELKGSIARSKIVDGLRAAGTELKVVDTAFGDIELYADRNFTVLEDGQIVTKDNVAGVTPGLDPKSWLTDQMKARPHWWPASVGGGAEGGGGAPGGVNPWSKEGWNLTNQGQVVKTQGQDKAEQMAKAAGHSGVAGARRPV